MTLVALLLPALVGGLLVAVVLLLVKPRLSPTVVTLEPISPDLINMAHIRVAGLGGLGMLGAVVVTAISLPEIGVALAAAIGLGAVMAVALIAYRGRGRTLGADGQEGPPPTLLALDDRAGRVAGRPTRQLPRASVPATA